MDRHRSNSKPSALVEVDNADNVVHITIQSKCDIHIEVKCDEEGVAKNVEINCDDESDEARFSVYGEVKKRIVQFAEYSDDDYFKEYVSDMLLDIMDEKSRDCPLKAIRYALFDILLLHTPVLHKVSKKACIEFLGGLFK